MTATVKSLWLPWLAFAACAGSPDARPVPPELTRVVVAPVRGPLLDGNGFPIRTGEWLTCRHVVPHDAQSCEIAGLPSNARPLAGGADPGLPGDWSLLRAPNGYTMTNAVDFVCSVPSGTEVWVVGWRALPDASPRFQRVAMRGRVTGDDSDAPTRGVTGFPVDQPGFSGAPVVLVDGDRALVIGIYCGYREHTTSLLGIPIWRVHESVFLRPSEVGDCRPERECEEKRCAH
jgi:hypothetical protein